uniref:Uncharacterized protein n=1 Tax=Anguilla anguilla TaxID=7936 RepID=A0A0E9WAB2_ANGAN
MNMSSEGQVFDPWGQTAVLFLTTRGASLKRGVCLNWHN